MGNLVTYNGSDSNELDRQLKELRGKVEEKRDLMSKFHFAQEALNDQYNRTKQLEVELQKEEKDVQKLESGGISSFISGIFGNKDKKLSKEKQEADAARARYDECVNILNSIEREVNNYREQIEAIGDIEYSYNDLLQRKREILLNGNSEGSMEIRRLLDEMDNCNNIIRELNEAIIAGNNALGALRSLEGALNDAKSCGVWDIAGGGYLASMAKHSHLDDAKRIAFEVRGLVGHFQRELRDTHIQFHFDIRIDDFDRFADHFFDNAWTDMNVQNKINNSLNQVMNTIRDIMGILSNLENSIISIQGDLERLEERIEEAIVNG